jgi:hypothetical protein
MNTHPFGTLELIAYRSGDLPAEKQAQIAAHLEQCAQCRDRLNDLAREQQGFLQKLPFESIKTAAPAARVLTFRRFSRPVYALAATLVLCLTAAFYYSSRVPSYRLKGDVSITLHVRGANDQIEVRPDQNYFPGEQIQLTYSCGDLVNFVLLSMDSSGAITTYYPFDRDSSIALPPGADLPLPNSIVLDDYLGRELYLAVFSRTALKVENIKARLEQAFAKEHALKPFELDLGRDAVCRSVIITKKRRPGQ